VYQGYGVEVLYSAFEESNNMLDLPSWVPNWASKSLPMLSIAPNTVLVDEYGLTCYSASGTSSSSITLIPDTNFISVQGIIFDRITVLGKYPKFDKPTGNPVKPVMRFVHSCIQEIESLLSGDNSSGDLSSISWRIIICNSSCLTASPTALASDDILGSKYRSLLVACDMFNHEDEKMKGKWTIEEIKTHIAAGDNFASTAMTYCKTKRRGKTAKGYVAQLPLLAKDDDVVFIPSGSAIPILLRKMGDGYSVVGECYVHGIMDGEAFQMTDMELQSITII
jgi:hypothetical protein